MLKRVDPTFPLGYPATAMVDTYDINHNDRFVSD